jgi:hypothetical protein
VLFSRDHLPDALGCGTTRAEVGSHERTGSHDLPSAGRAQRKGKFPQTSRAA